MKSNDISSNSKENIKDSSAEIERLHLLLNESINKLDNILKKFDGAEIIKEIYRSGLAYDEGNSRSSNRLPPAFGRSNIIKIERLAILKEKAVVYLQRMIWLVFTRQLRRFLNSMHYMRLGWSLRNMKTAGILDI